MATQELTGVQQRTDHAGDTAPLPTAALSALARLEYALESPVERLNRQIADLEISLRVQRQLRDSDLVQAQNPMASAQERAEAEQWFRTAVANVAFLREKLARKRAELAAVTVYETAAVHAVQLAALAEAGPLSDLDADSLAHAEDLMAGARATLASAGRLDLIDPLHAKAAEYYALAAVVDRLSSRESHYMTSSDWQEVYAAQEEQTRLHFELKRAGRLDLIGGA